jgi:uncharacterized protein YkuJ
MGYSVYRVRNKEVESSPFDIVGRIVDRYYQITEVEGEGEAKDRKKYPLQDIDIIALELQEL